MKLNDRLKRPLSITLIGLFCILLLFLSLRNQLLHWGIRKASVEINERTGAILHIGESSFSGLFSISMKEIYLIPSGGDTLLTADTLAFKIAFWPLFTATIRINELYSSGLNLRISFRNHEFNYQGLFHEKSIDSVEKSGTSYSLMIGRILNKAFNLAPQEARLGNIILSYRNDTLERSVFIKEFYSDKNSLNGMAEDKLTQTAWHCNGRFSQSHHTLEINVYPKDSKVALLPLSKELLGLAIGFDTVHISMKGYEWTNNSLTTGGSIYVENLKTFHRKLSEDTIRIIRAAFDFNFKAGKSFVEIDSSSSASLSSIHIHPYLRYSNEKLNDKEYELKLTTDTTNSNDFFSSLPEGMFDEVRQIKASGTLHYSLVFKINSTHPDSVIFESSLKKDKFRIKSFGTSDLMKMNGEFMYSVYEKDRFIVKGTTSWFDRNIETNVFGMKATQLSYFTEASYLKKWDNNDLVAGVNFTGEKFRKKLPDSTKINNYNNSTLGFFIQDDWRISSKFIVQSGLRTDHHNQYGNFVLPRISLLYKISSHFTTRLGGGLGYKIPSAFSSEIDERDYLHLLPLQNIKAERSVGANWDLNYHQKINEWDLTVNQALFTNRINDPLIATTGGGFISYSNAEKPITTKGYETYIQVLHNALEIYFGYILTSAKRLYNTAQPNLDLIAKNKFATIVAYEFSHHFRGGIESAYTGKQFLDDGSRTQGYLFMAAMMRYDYKKFSFVLNCENLLDYRQTKKENIIIPPAYNPQFKQLWAPIDGRVVNFSVRIKL